jgi:hypothetical protein
VSSSERRRERREQRARELARWREQQAQHSGAIEAPPSGQTEIAEPSTPPGLARAVARWVAKWVWLDKSQLVTWLFRLFTVLSVLYLVYDRIYETDLSATSVASDPNDAFKYPFSINNNRHLNMTRDLIRFGAGANLSIPAGQNLNIGCNPYSVISVEQKSKITSAVIGILLLYDVDILWFHWHRVPSPAFFTWVGDASNPQWVRGRYAGQGG